MKKVVFLIFLLCSGKVMISQSDTSIVSAEEEQLKIARGNELANTAWTQIEKSDFKGAIITCQEGLKIDAANLYLKGNLAHANLFAGNYDEAIDIYRQNIGKIFDSGMTWRDMIKQDFESFKAKGLDSKSMDKVLKDSVISLE